MQKTAALEAYVRFAKFAKTEKDDPTSVGKLIGTGVSGGLFGPLGGGIASAINAPEGKGWPSFGLGFLGGLPGAALASYGMQTGNPAFHVLGRLGAGGGSALAHYLYHRKD